MALLRLSEFFCGRSLKFGTYFVGWAEIVFSIIWMAAVLFSLFSHDAYVHPIKHVKMLNTITHVVILLFSVITLFSGVVLILSVQQEFFNFIEIWVNISVWLLVIIYVRSIGELIVIFVEDDYIEGLFYLLFYTISLAQNKFHWAN